jgi:hypothetical protein
MNSKLRKLFFSEFSALLAEELSGFVPYKEKTQYVWPGEAVYRDQVLIAPRSAFLVLSPHEKVDAISIQAGWSSDSQFPELTMRPSIPQWELNDPVNMEAGTINVLDFTSSVAFGWVNGYLEVSQEHVTPIAARLLEIFVQHGIPYLLRMK